METNIIVPDKIQENIVDLSIIQNIYVIRGYKVMLDFDLASRYEVETRVLKQSVRRNIKRFEGEDFMFELTKEEVTELSRSQIVTLNTGRGYNIKYPPFAFTQLGVSMLSSVLHSEKAIDTNRKIMRAFAAFQQYALTYAEIKKDLDEFMRETNMRFNEIYQVLNALVSQKEESDKPRNPIGFKQKTGK